VLRTGSQVLTGREITVVIVLSMASDVEREQADLCRRSAVLRLSVAPLQRRGFVAPNGHGAGSLKQWGGPDGTAFAVWRFREGVSRRQVTWHVPGRRRVIGAVDVETDLRVSFVQKLPEGVCSWGQLERGRVRPMPKYGPGTAIYNTEATSVTPSMTCSPLPPGGVSDQLFVRQWAGVAQKGTASRASTATSPSIVRGAVTIAQFFRALR
jgi:hypothetical protein